MTKPRALISWSSGKDSAWALHTTQQAGEYDVVGLLSATNETHERVAMHAVRLSLLRMQAESAGLPLTEVPLPWPCPNGLYEERMGEAVARAKAAGVTHMIFGDLFLEDIRRYREDKLTGSGITPVFPLFGSDTRKLAEEMQAAGLVAHLTTVDPAQLPQHFVGRRWDRSLLEELPEGVDPCGENGEFHTFVSEGPMLKTPLSVRIGSVVEREGFHYCDLLAAPSATAAPLDGNNY